MNNWQILTLGILEDNKERLTFNMLKRMFQDIGYELHYINKTKNIAILKKIDKEILVVDIRPDMIDSIGVLDINFDILIHNFIKLNSLNKEKIKKILRISKSIILNCDVDNWDCLIKDNKESVVISYGFSNKAFINLSSYDIDSHIKANICFQRGLRTIYGDIVDPFELTTVIKSKQKDDIYSAMAILVFGILTGHDVLLENDILSL